MSQIDLSLSYFRFLLPTALLSCVTTITKIFESSSESQLIMKKDVVVTDGTNNGNLGNTTGCNTSGLEYSNHKRQKAMNRMYESLEPVFGYGRFFRFFLRYCTNFYNLLLTLYYLIQI
jgi:hypothetical protein